MVVLLEIDVDETESDVHLLADLNGFLEGEVEGGDGFFQAVVIFVEFGFGEKGVSYFCLAEVLLSILYFIIDLDQQLLESLLYIHRHLNYF